MKSGQSRTPGSGKISIREKNDGCLKNVVLNELEFISMPQDGFTFNYELKPKIGDDFLSILLIIIYSKKWRNGASKINE